MSGIPAFGLIDCQLGRVRELIDKQLTVPAKAGDIKPLLECVSTRSGKMLRPGLVLLAGGCCGKIIDEHIRVAAARRTYIHPYPALTVLANFIALRPQFLREIQSQNDPHTPDRLGGDPVLPVP